MDYVRLRSGAQFWGASRVDTRVVVYVSLIPTLHAASGGSRTQCGNCCCRRGVFIGQARSIGVFGGWAEGLSIPTCGVGGIGVGSSQSGHWQTLLRGEQTKIREIRDHM